VSRRALGVGLVLVLAGGSSAAQTSPPAGEVLTLDDAVTLALQNNRRLGVATQELERAEQRVEAARTQRLPSVEIEAIAGTTLNSIRVSYPTGAFGTFPDIGPIPSEDTDISVPRALTGNVSASVAQPLTGLHRIGLNTRLHETSRDIEREKLRGERATVVADVRRLYYELLHGQSALAAAEEQVRVYRELDRVVSEQVALEVALQADGLEVKSRLASEEHRLAGLRGDLATGKERMNQLLGRELSQDLSLAPVTETSLEEVDLASALAQALERRPDLAQARLAVEQADTDRRLKKAEGIPDLNLAITYTSYVNVDLLPRNVAIAGLQLKWTPFDWGRRGKEVAEKTIQVEQARVTAREAESQARIEVAHYFRKLQEARLLIEAGRLGREAARERLKLASERHRAEAALLQDVLQAQAALSAASAQYDEALFAFWTARADFQKAIGEEL
jgi:outer membrane protein TolC